MIHSNSTRNHKIENWTYANAGARTGASGFLSTDLGKLAFQTDNSTYWRLTATTPTWEQAMAGPTGAAGAVWRNGAGAPDNAVGVDGDFYLRTSNGDVYKRVAGVYGVVVNIIGPAGAAGSTGPAGPGVPVGGTAGQVLSKIDGTNYNTQWVASPGGFIVTRKVAPADLTGNTFDFTSIPAHRMLRLIFVGRIVNTGTGDDVPLIARLLLNNAFGGIGIKNKFVGAAAPVQSLTTNTGAGMEIGEVQSLNADPGGGSTSMSEIIFEQPEYANTAIQRGSLSRSMWKDTVPVMGFIEYALPHAASAAITRVTLSFDGIAAGNLKAGSFCVLELSD